MQFVYILILLPFYSNGVAVPTILDTDIGTAYDDQLALTYILSRQDLFDIKLIVCSTSNTTARAQIVAKTLSIFKRFDIPIAIGRYISDGNLIYQYRWAENYSLETFQVNGGLVYIDGEEALFNTMKNASVDHIYHYILIGPATTLGQVLQKQPSLAHSIRLFAMAGSIYRGYENSNMTSKEYNVVYDIESAQRVFSSEWKYFSLSPLDCTNFMQFYGSLWQNFLSYRNISDIVHMISESFTIWYDEGGKTMDSVLPYDPESGTPEMHDVLSVYLSGIYSSVSPTNSTILSVFVTNDGYTRQDDTNEKQRISVCLNYDVSDPYIATSEIGAVILKSITQIKKNETSNNCNHLRINLLTSLTMLLLTMLLCTNCYI